MIPGETIAGGADRPEGGKLKVVGRGGTFYVAWILKGNVHYSRESIYFATEVAATDVLLALGRVDVKDWSTVRGVRR